ncbi:hypothetical protein BURK1_02447 [Burkholderiales bacterium]|nr:hypothetical protein BURK1_02447 [Burkholderiales bacterium]
MFGRLCVHASALFALALAPLPSFAGSSRFAADHPAWRAECGSCHTAYPPALMSAPAWRQVIGALDRHYGTDASLDAGTGAAIAAFLERNAGVGRKAAQPYATGVLRRTGGTPSLPRITESAWFTREHDEVPAATIARPDVRGFANCGACHTAADRGDFSERALRVPR